MSNYSNSNGSGAHVSSALLELIVDVHPSISRMGAPVFPLFPLTKKPLNGSHGLKDAVPPDALDKKAHENYGVYLGDNLVVADFDCLDFDADPEVAEFYRQCVEAVTWRQRTGGNSRCEQFMFRTTQKLPTAAKIRGKSGKIYGDFKSGESYIVGPNSEVVADKGPHYDTSAKYIVLTDADPVELPETIRAFILACATTAKKPTYLRDLGSPPPVVDSIPLGEHRPAIRLYMIGLRKLGYTDELIFNMTKAAVAGGHWLKGHDPKDRFRDGDLRKLITGIRAKPDSAAPRFGTGDEAQSLALTRADTVPIKRIEWLLPGRVPFGGITLFEGEGGKGKTTFLLGMIAGATRGRDFFTGAPITPQTCLIVGIEDNRAITVQRLRMYGADLTRIQFVDAARIGDKNAGLVLPDHVDALDRAVTDQGARLVYIDALFSHLNLPGDGKMAHQVRAALEPIRAMFDRLEVAFVAVRHWTKSTGAAASRGLGSVEFFDMARAVFAFGENPHNADQVAVAPTKGNYAKKLPAVAFEVIGRDVRDDDGQPWNVSVAENVHEIEGVTGDDLANRQLSDPDEGRAAVDWLSDRLCDGGWHAAGKVVSEATKQKVGSRATMYRARAALKVESMKSRIGEGAMWRMPRVSLPDAAAPG
jgi:hypothetical protein